jgi:predicted ATPase/DNA-binding SARP family transcriptional activator
MDAGDAMPSLKLFLLGPPRLERDGLPIEFDTRKNTALVAYLAMTAGSHRREVLMTLLWPELEPGRARGVLRRNLSVLKKALGGDWLVVEREAVGTAPDADFWFDVDQFHALLQTWQEHNHPEGETCPECQAALAEAVDLYRGDFMAGFSLPDSAAFDEFQFFQAEGLRQELAGALEQLARGHGSRGEFERAIPYARHWVGLDPLHEPAQRWLMGLYAQAGRRAAALRQYEACARILEAEMGLTPSAQTASLYERIRAGEIGGEGRPIPNAFPRHNLPVQSTRFIGRQAVLTEIADRLRDSDCRLLTLVGPGGSGKTRLALEAAAALLDEFAHGVFFVSLAPLQSAEAILPAVAQAVGFSFYGTSGDQAEIDPQQQLLGYLRNKRMLLVLDNFEHLLAGVGFVTAVLDAASGVSIMVTSRTKLNLQGEHLFPVAGMSIPDSAAELFVTSARRVRPDFDLTTGDLADVIRICRVVEGMPLGILLAAAWVQVLSPAAIAAQISQSIDFLETDLCDLPERHRSMRAVFDHSWNLLSARLQEVMQALSIFRGGFTWQAAQAVADASLRDLRALVSGSLLHRTSTSHYEVHELLRQYAADRLRRAEELERSPDAGEAARDRHGAYYVSALQQWETDLKGSRQQEALAEMDGESGNIRAAWQWAVEQGAVGRLDQAVEGLCLFYTRRGRYEEGAVLCRTAAESLQATSSDAGLSVRARVLAWRSAFEQELGRIELAGQLLRQSQDLVEKLESSRQGVWVERAFVLLRMGEMAYHSRYTEAGRLLEQSLALYRALDDRWRTANVLRDLGSIALNVGNYGRAKQLYEESLAIRRALGDQWGIANSLQGLGRVSLSLGEIEAGEHLAQEGVALAEEIGDQGGVVKGLGNLSLLLSWSGRFAEAQAALERSRAICEDLGFRIGLVYVLAHQSTVMGHQGEYEPARALAYQCLAVAREINHSWGLGYATMLLGDLALVEDKAAEAWRFFEQSLSVYRDAGQQDAIGFAVVFSAVATLRMGQSSTARQGIEQALRMVCTIGEFGSLVTAVAAAALFLIEQDRPERAVELYATASRYPLVSGSCWYRDIFERRVATIAATLPPEVVEAAHERGRARDLQMTVADLLVELGLS